ncbi:hypothetical protein EDB92DRAFT_1053137 [Lactarius akahatsu]|uniref:Uncharacterized protein n=1 Tax=Lactarius akahatsu TaxID=416441 RepID=A0AAD4LE18_9AGAM|nr:hypothetical protein EDB92DRAFT_1053137 [Lactarius akahatsu]
MEPAVTKLQVKLVRVCRLCHFSAPSPGILQMLSVRDRTCSQACNHGHSEGTQPEASGLHQALTHPISPDRRGATFQRKTLAQGRASALSAYWHVPPRPFEPSEKLLLWSVPCRGFAIRHWLFHPLVTKNETGRLSSLRSREQACRTCSPLTPRDRRGSPMTGCGATHRSSLPFLLSDVLGQLATTNNESMRTFIVPQMP